MHVLFSALVAPLEEGMLHALQGLYGITGSWGLALFALSIGVNLGLLPFYRVAERWQNAERDFQARLRPKLDEIRSAFTGEERFLMTKALYRQASYHPVLALRSAAGFLLQVPVFIAAYHALKDFYPMIGANFGPIADLSRPDGLLRLGGVAINVLPPLMTAVNLVTVAIAARKPGSERLQLAAIAAAFLVLLYRMPAALVLYWTFNNVFALVKHVVSRRDAATEASWLRWETGPLALLFLVLCAADPHTLWQTPSTLGVKLTVAGLLYAILLRLLRTTRFGRDDGYGVKRLLLIAASVTAFLAYVQSDSTYAHNLRVMLLAVGFGIVYGALTLDRDQVRSPLGLNISLAALTLASILFVFNPLLMYFASPDRIGTINGLMIANLVLLAALAALLLVKGRAVVGRFERGYAIVLGWAAAVAFLYGYVVILNYGLLRDDRFTEERILLDRVPGYLALELGGLLLLGFAIKWAIERLPRALPIYFSIVLVLLSGRLATAWRSYAAAAVQPAPLGAAVAGKFPTVFRLGTERNVVLIVPDACPGPLVREILGEDPALRSSFAGFVLYGNTAAVGTFTLSNTAALVGGPAYTPTEVNRRADKTLDLVLVEAYRGLVRRLKQNRYAVNITGPSAVDCTDLAEADACADTRSYRDALYDLHDFELVNAFDQRLLFLMSAFKSMPLQAKSWLYRSRYWSQVFRNPPKSLQSERYYQYLIAKSLPELSEVGRGADGRAFVHVWLDPLIAPFYLDANCEVGDGGWDMWQVQARKDSTRCLLRGLARWFAWMKEQGIYDQTKIIIAADHGAGEFGENWYKAAATPLLMVKDFDQAAEMQVSEILMSNSDVPSIICSALDTGCADLPADPSKSVAPDRAVTFAITTHGDRGFLRTNQRFDIVRDYEIRGRVEEWQRWVETGRRQ